jgi:serine protease AprX
MGVDKQRLNQIARRRPVRSARLVRLGSATVAVLLVIAGLTGTSQHRRARASQLSVIVRGVPGRQADLAAAVKRLGGRVTHPLGIIGGFSAVVPSSGLAYLSRDPNVVSVTPDAGLTLMGTTYDSHKDINSLFNLENMIGARNMWGHWSGTGIDVALIDSGVAPVAGLSDPGKVLDGPDLTEESQNPDTAHLDTFGHGTTLAGIIAGHDTGVDPATNQGNAVPFMGVAPSARIVSVKVADAMGMTDVSQVIAGIDWVVQHAHDPGMNIRVLNLSFGTNSTQDYQLDPVAFAAEVAWRSGIVVVVSAGNAGNTSGHLTNPATDPYVIAVGADDMHGHPSVDASTIPTFSSQGDGVRNPDIVAPGAHVQSLRVNGSHIDSQYASTGAINDRYFRGSGTSQAAAVVSGSVALLLQQRPAWTPDQVKAQLTATAMPLKNVDVRLQGNGLINLRKATGGATAQPAQTFAKGNGNGSLNNSRGGANQVLGGVVLNGDVDIFGQPVDTSALAAAELSGSSWSGGSWNGSSWSGSSWSGSSWSGSSWSGSSWSGSSWSSNHWSSGKWSGSSWSGSSWSGSSWSGSSWSGEAWAGHSWSDFVWATDSWS